MPTFTDNLNYLLDLVKKKIFGQVKVSSENDNFQVKPNPSTPYDSPKDTGLNFFNYAYGIRRSKSMQTDDNVFSSYGQYVIEEGLQYKIDSFITLFGISELAFADTDPPTTKFGGPVNVQTFHFYYDISDQGVPNPGDALFIARTQDGNFGKFYQIIDVEQVISDNTWDITISSDESFSSYGPSYYVNAVVYTRDPMAMMTVANGTLGREQTFVFSSIPVNTGVSDEIEADLKQIDANRVGNILPPKIYNSRIDAIFQSDLTNGSKIRDAQIGTDCSKWDLGIVLYPDDGLGNPDFTKPIFKRNPVIDSTIPLEDQKMVIDYANGVVHFTVPPRAGDDINPNGVTGQKLRLWACFASITYASQEFDTDTYRAAAHNSSARNLSDFTERGDSDGEQEIAARCSLPSFIRYNQGRNAWEIFSGNNYLTPDPDVAPSQGFIIGTPDVPGALGAPNRPGFLWDPANNGWSVISTPNFHGTPLNLVSKNTDNSGNKIFAGIESYENPNWHKLEYNEDDDSGTGGMWKVSRRSVTPTWSTLYPLYLKDGVMGTGARNAGIGTKDGSDYDYFEFDASTDSWNATGSNANFLPLKLFRGNTVGAVNPGIGTVVSGSDNRIEFNQSQLLWNVKNSSINSHIMVGDVISIGDGVNSNGHYNGATIAPFTSAIAALPNGGTILVGPGTYNWGASQITLPGNIRIIGLSYGNCIITSNYTGAGSVITISSNNVTISDVTFKFLSSSGSYTSFITSLASTNIIYKCNFDNNGLSGFYGYFINSANTASNLWIDSCSFNVDVESGPQFIAINVFPNNTKITNCQFTGTGTPPHFIYMATSGNAVSKFLISNNTFFTKVSVAAIKLNLPQSGIIDKNIYNFDGTFFEIMGGTDITITNNIQNPPLPCTTDFYGILFDTYSATNIKILGNFIGPVYSSSTVSGLTISNNNITSYGALTSAISFYADSSVKSDVKINSNTIVSQITGTGYYVIDLQSAAPIGSVKNFEIINNTISNELGNDRVGGIRVSWQVAGLKISHNTIVGYSGTYYDSSMVAEGINIAWNSIDISSLTYSCDITQNKVVNFTDGIRVDSYLASIRNNECIGFKFSGISWRPRTTTGIDITSDKAIGVVSSNYLHDNNQFSFGTYSDIAGVVCLNMLQQIVDNNKIYNLITGSPCYIYGILAQTHDYNLPIGKLIVSDSHINNLVASNTGTSNQILGIYCKAPGGIVENNRIYNISGTRYTQCWGIDYDGNTSGSVCGNQVRSISVTGANTLQQFGIDTSTNTITNCKISNNGVYDITNAGSGTISCILFGQGSYNNVIGNTILSFNGGSGATHGLDFANVIVAETVVAGNSIYVNVGGANYDFYSAPAASLITFIANRAKSSNITPGSGYMNGVAIHTHGIGGL